MTTIKGPKPKKQRGRPRREAGTLDARLFVRAVAVMCAYDEARKRDEKHSVAVRCAVDDYKQRYPQRRISETGVKRILATWRPRGSRVILLFERQSPTEESVKRLRWIKEQFAKVAGKDLQSEVRCSPEVRPRSGSIVARFGERPNYPRHNRKDK